MDLFQINKKSSSIYRCILKILGSAIIIGLMFFRERVIHLEAVLLKQIATAICALLIGPCIMCFYIAVINLFYSVKNKRHESLLQSAMVNKRTKQFPVSQIVDLIYKNDIIEFEVLFHGNVMKIGASSNWDRRTGRFFDKLYYINDSTVSTIEELQKELRHYGVTEVVAIASIDGVKQQVE